MLSIVSARFVKSAVHAKDFPIVDLPEFAFFGRSNAGKSSLINLLLNRKQLVKTGSTPGMTNTINFFSVNEARLHDAFFVVDLPGYGFAKVKKHDINAFNAMLSEYCTQRTNLKCVFLLMDIRRPPSSVELDIVNFFIELKKRFCIVATKCDKLPKAEQHKQVKALTDFFSLSHDQLIMTSTLKKIGREHILRIIQQELI